MLKKMLLLYFYKHLRMAIKGNTLLKIFSSNIPIISQYIIKKDLDAIIFLV